MKLNAWERFAVIPSLVWLLCGAVMGYLATHNPLQAAAVAILPVIAGWGLAWLVTGIAMWLHAGRDEG